MVATPTATTQTHYTNEELYYLGTLLQVNDMLGITDPYPGFLADEITEHMAAIKEVLLQRGDLVTDGNGEVRLGAALSALVDAVAASSESLMISTSTYPTPDATWFIHRIPSGGVVQAGQPDGRIDLQMVPEADTARRVQDALGPVVWPAAPGPAFLMAESALTEARTQAEAHKQATCRTFLSTQKIPPEAVGALIEALGPGRRAGSVITLLRTPRTMRYGPSVMWLGGPHGAWRLQPVERDGHPSSLRFFPTSTPDLREQLRRLALRQSVTTRSEVSNAL
ncbi:MAG: ESX secretion-associated protein EspG [Chloroflexota bacterium]|nr:ESX secretion-associated protein EspG [Chloroflexota bacterium]